MGIYSLFKWRKYWPIPICALLCQRFWKFDLWCCQNVDWVKLGWWNQRSETKVADIFEARYFANEKVAVDTDTGYDEINKKWTVNLGNTRTLWGTIWGYSRWDHVEIDHHFWPHQLFQPLTAWVVQIAKPRNCWPLSSTGRSKTKLGLI